MECQKTKQIPKDSALPEVVQQIEIGALHPFANHPFRVLEDESMHQTVESIQQMGIANPLIVRPDSEGGYEIISGHRRHYAAALAGLQTLPVIVREMDDDAAVIMMVDSNLQRENILPSEKAHAYQMKLQALKHQGRTVSRHDGEKLDWAVAQVSADANESERQVHRFVRLTNLIPELMDMVDEKKIAMTPAVELSYLKPEEQREFLDAMDYAQAAPSLSQAQRIKKLSQAGDCDLERMCGIMDEVKKDDLGKIAFKTSELQKFFPRSYTPKQMSNTIVRLLGQWQRRRQREQQR